MGFYVILLVAVVSCFIHVQARFTVLKEDLVLVRELDTEMSGKRNLEEELPQHLPLEVTTNEGRIHLMLQRENWLKDLDVLVETDGREMPVNMDHKNIGIYSDMDKDAVIQLARDKSSGKREYTGHLIHENQHFELSPMSGGGDSTDMRVRNLWGAFSGETDLPIHSLKHVQVRSSGRDDFDLKNDQRRKFEDIEKEMLKTENSVRSSDTDDQLPSNDRPMADPSDNNGTSGERFLSVPDTDTDNVANSDKLAEKMQQLLSLLRQQKDQKRASESRQGDMPWNFWGKHRRKRELPKVGTDPNANYLIPVVIFLDPSIYAYWVNLKGSKAVENIGFYVSHLYNAMNMIFRRIPDTSGFKITPWLKEIKIFKTRNDVAFLQDAKPDDSTVDANGVYNLLFNYRENNDKYSWLKTGHVMYLTKEDVMVGHSSSVVGASPSCSVCDPVYGFSIIEDHGLFSHLAMTHELSHNLGARHDGKENDCKPEDMFIMTPKDIVLTADNVKNGQKHSECSLRSMRACLSARSDGIGKACVSSVSKDSCTTQPVEGLNELPGERYSLDQQCQMFVDKAAKYDETCAGDPCLRLGCSVNGVCRYVSKELKPVPGTPCGKRKVCMFGECVKKNMGSYSDLSCRQKRSVDLNPVPSDCKADANPTTCKDYAETWPFIYFTNYKMRAWCPTTCQEYGLYFDLDSPCYSYDLGRVACPTDKTKSIKISQINDGTSDCPGGYDEMEFLAEQLSIKVPGCNSENTYHDPHDFNICLTKAQICSKYESLCNLLNEKHLE